VQDHDVGDGLHGGGGDGGLLVVVSALLLFGRWVVSRGFERPVN
jgi:hypothetical protein